MGTWGDAFAAWEGVGGLLGRVAEAVGVGGLVWGWAGRWLVGLAGVVVGLAGVVVVGLAVVVVIVVVFVVASGAVLLSAALVAVVGVLRFGVRGLSFLSLLKQLRHTRTRIMLLAS